MINIIAHHTQEHNFQISLSSVLVISFVLLTAIALAYIATKFKDSDK